MFSGLSSIGNVERESGMTNPFEDPDASYLVLINDEGQHSLWPVFADVPEGWEQIFGEAGRQDCLDFIETNWTDMRPRSLIKAMEEDAAEREKNAAATNGAAKEKTAKQRSTRASTKSKGKNATAG
jgi:MbtH protein